MRTIRRMMPVAAVAFLAAGCVSVEEAPMTAGAIQRDQRVLLAVFASPGPVVSADDTKAETAAKIMPGLGLVVKDAQDQRDLKASKDLQQYLPGWEPEEMFTKPLFEQIRGLGQPGKLLMPSDTEIPAADWRRLNRATDVLDWQLRYFVPQPADVAGRNYSTFLTLDDALVLEVNLAYGLTEDVENVNNPGTYAPTVKAVTKLLRAGTLRQLWRNEAFVMERGAGKSIYDFKLAPAELIYAWKRLMPMLVPQIVDNLRKNLLLAGIPLAPGQGSGAAAPSASALPAGPGWGPAPAPEATPAPMPVPTAATPSETPSPAPAPFVPGPSTP